MRAIEPLRSAVRQERYRIRAHANEALTEDDLTAQGVESIVLGGAVTRRFTRAPRGSRYEFTGRAADGRVAAVVCRFLPSGVRLMVTRHAEEESRDEQAACRPLRVL